MLTILNVVAPVFALIMFGYGAVKWKFYPLSGVGGLIAFVNGFATPVLLFRAMLNADFSTSFDFRILIGFYAGAFICFLGGALVASRFFGNRPGVAVASGFAAAFSNTVLIGIPILNRAYGDAAMPFVYSIIGFHAPVLLTIAMVSIELVRRDGGKVSVALGQAWQRARRNPLLWGIIAGIGGNWLGLRLIEPVDAVTIMMSQAVLPVALFGLGGALNEYRMAENWPQAAAMSTLKLFVQPAAAYVILVPILRVDPMIARYGVLLAAMPTGINAYIFSTYYRRGENVATNTILLSTVGAVVSVTLWLYLLSL